MPANEDHSLCMLFCIARSEASLIVTWVKELLPSTKIKSFSQIHAAAKRSSFGHLYTYMIYRPNSSAAAFFLQPSPGFLAETRGCETRPVQHNAQFAKYYKWKSVMHSYADMQVLHIHISVWAHAFSSVRLSSWNRPLSCISVLSHLTLYRQHFQTVLTIICLDQIDSHTCSNFVRYVTGAKFLLIHACIKTAS